MYIPDNKSQWLPGHLPIQKEAQPLKELLLLLQGFLFLLPCLLLLCALLKKETLSPPGHISVRTPFHTTATISIRDGPLPSLNPSRTKWDITSSHSVPSSSPCKPLLKPPFTAGSRNTHYHPPSLEYLLLPQGTHPHLPRPLGLEQPLGPNWH